MARRRGVTRARDVLTAELGAGSGRPPTSRMATLLDHLIPGLWLGWAIYWSIAAFDVKRTRRRESLLSRAAHLAMLLAAAVLLGAPELPGFLGDAVWTGSKLTRDGGTLLVAAGLMFACWARFDLGRNWSGIVALKEKHELIVSGPYRIVRHPIYAGLLAATVGTAIALDEWRGLIGVAVACVAAWRKVVLEERLLGERFGVAYAVYRRKVAAVVPFLL